jgi:hypothetical protein
MLLNPLMHNSTCADLCCCNTLCCCCTPCRNEVRSLAACTTGCQQTSLEAATSCANNKRTTLHLSYLQE